MVLPLLRLDTVDGLAEAPAQAGRLEVTGEMGHYMAQHLRLLRVGESVHVTTQGYIRWKDLLEVCDKAARVGERSGRAGGGIGRDGGYFLWHGLDGLPSPHPALSKPGQVSGAGGTGDIADIADIEKQAFNGENAGLALLIPAWVISQKAGNE